MVTLFSLFIPAFMAALFPFALEVIFLHSGNGKFIEEVVRRLEGEKLVESYFSRVCY